MTDISVIPAHELTESQVAQWAEIQQTDETLDSPYFRPEFCQAIAAVRNDVHVAIIERGGQAAGFFPFQRTRWGNGYPVGGRLSDFQAIIAAPGVKIGPETLLRSCRLRNWEFHHLLASQQQFAANSWETEDSPYMDLSNGFEAYVRSRREDTQELTKLPRKIRKMEREQGELRFELQCDDQQVFDTLIAWKSQQYQRTGLTDVFAFPWTLQALERIWRSRSDAFTGLLSVLYCGDQIAAIHFGMRSHGVLHSWFPVYNTDLHKYSPGLSLFYHLAQAGAENGIRRIDLGRGDEPYKVSLRSGGVPVSEGVLVRSQWRQNVRRCVHDFRNRLKQTHLYTFAQGPLAMLRPWREWMAFR